jgi:signal-transduction protein with cAMP-binding, CBS, and nucleotidyltransferase domain
MTKFVFYIDPDKCVADAIILMKTESLSSLIVNGKWPNDPWGIVTRKDVVNQVIGPDRDPHEVKVHEIMSKPLITVPPDFTLTECALLMGNKGIRRVAVYDGKSIVGLLSNTDIFNVIKV